MSFKPSQIVKTAAPCGKASFTSTIDFSPKQDATMNDIAQRFGSWLKEYQAAIIAKALQNSRSV